MKALEVFPKVLRGRPFEKFQSLDGFEGDAGWGGVWVISDIFRGGENISCKEIPGEEVSCTEKRIVYLSACNGGWNKISYRCMSGGLREKNSYTNQITHTPPQK